MIVSNYNSCYNRIFDDLAFYEKHKYVYFIRSNRVIDFDVFYYKIF